MALAIVATAALLGFAIVFGGPIVRWPAAVLATMLTAGIGLRLAWPLWSPLRRWPAVAGITILLFFASPFEWLIVAGALALSAVTTEWLCGARLPAAALTAVMRPILNLTRRLQWACRCVARLARYVARPGGLPTPKTKRSHGIEFSDRSPSRSVRHRSCDAHS